MKTFEQKVLKDWEERIDTLIIDFINEQVI